jgi:uncharacterized protein
MLEELSGKGDSCARLSLARLLVRSERDRKIGSSRAMQLLSQAAKSGLIAAQYELGLEYLGRPAGKPDFQSAVYWLYEAARRGHGPSQVVLGKMFLTGYGVRKNFQAGYGWLLLADKTGDDQARLILDSMAATLNVR